MPRRLSTHARHVIFPRPSPQTQLFDEVKLRRSAHGPDPFIQPRKEKSGLYGWDSTSITAWPATARKFSIIGRNGWRTLRITFGKTAWVWWSLFVRGDQNGLEKSTRPLRGD